MRTTFSQSVQDASLGEPINNRPQEMSVSLRGRPKESPAEVHTKTRYGEIPRLAHGYVGKRCSRSSSLRTQSRFGGRVGVRPVAGTIWGRQRWAAVIAGLLNRYRNLRIWQAFPRL